MSTGCDRGRWVKGVERRHGERSEERAQRSMSQRPLRLCPRVQRHRWKLAVVDGSQALKVRPPLPRDPRVIRLHRPIGQLHYRLSPWRWVAFFSSGDCVSPERASVSIRRRVSRTVAKDVDRVNVERASVSRCERASFSVCIVSM